MKVKVDSDRLRLGMYVAELDRPWIGTPFLFQGFLIEEPDELAQLREVSRFVFVDDLRSSQQAEVQEAIRSVMGGLRSGRVKKLSVEFEEWKGADKLRATLSKLNQTVDRSRERMGKVLEDVRLGRSLQAEETRAVVSDLVDSVQRNPQTAQWMMLMRTQNEQIASHCMNVSVLATSFARYLGWGESMLNIVGEGGMLHDAGMSRVPKWILEKPGPLSRVEFELVKKHSAYAAKLMADARIHDPRVIEIVKHHHERMDGSGYPDALRGNEIPDYVQLVAIADVYEAMTTPKPYEPALSASVALTRLHKRSDRHFSRQLVEAFIRNIGIYPLSSLISLQNGSLGIVISSQEENRLKPVVLLVKDANGKMIFPRRMVNLAALEKMGASAGWSVDRIIDQKDAGIDVQKILLEEFMMR